MESAVQLADRHNDIDLGYEARRVLMNLAQHAGHPDIALVAFTWRLGQHKADPRRFPAETLLWEYKWIAVDLVRYSQFSREQIEETVRGMAEQYERANASARSVVKVRWWNALWMADFDQVREALPRWEALPRDQWADCRACDMSDPATARLLTGDVAGGLELARRVIDGRYRCLTVPRETYGEMVLPLLRLGRYEDAAVAYRTGRQMLRDNRHLVRALGNYVAYLTLTGALSRATALLERYFHWVDGRMPPLDQLYLFLNARLLTDRLGKAGRAGLQIRNAPLARLDASGAAAPSTVVTVAELDAWLQGRTGVLAMQFDARNRNRYFADVVLPAYDAMTEEHFKAGAASAETS
jgi:hypothetical protein